jgi:hypothetical protein
MTREFENQLQRMFADAELELPAADFTARIVSDLQRPRRRERLIWCTSVLAALAFLWFSLPALEPALGVVAASAGVFPNAAIEAMVTLSRSPLVYVYGTALGAYLLVRLLNRFPLRLL